MRWRLASLPFPGNVRQLENLSNWLTVMAPAQVIEQKDLPPDLTPRQDYVAESLAVSTDGAVAPVPIAVNGEASSQVVAATAGVAASIWENGLRTEVARLLRENSADVIDECARRFEAAVIREALDFTRGRKVEAAERLRIGRNTITRKIQSCIWTLRRIGERPMRDHARRWRCLGEAFVRDTDIQGLSGPE